MSIFGSEFLSFNFSGGTALALTTICYSFVSPAFRKITLPYVPATPTQISNILKALQGRSGRLIDLGSGDGRIVSQYCDYEEKSLPTT